MNIDCERLILLSLYNILPKNIFPDKGGAGYWWFSLRTVVQAVFYWSFFGTPCYMYSCYMYVGFGKSKAGSWERTRHHTLATWVQVKIIADFQFTTSNQYQGQFSGQGYTFSLIPISRVFGEWYLVSILLTAEHFFHNIPISKDIS